MASLRPNQTLITGGTFTTHVHPPETSTKEGMAGLKLLHNQIATGAFHNSAERYDAPKCHPRTREAILQEIVDWTDSDSEVHPFLWIYGPAGTGKSSIAQSTAERLYKEGKLAASFFFSRTAAGRNTDSRLIATIAYQLALSIPEINKLMAEALDRDPLIFSRSLEAQMEALIVNPLQAVDFDKPKVASGEYELHNLPVKLKVASGEDESENLPVPKLIIIDGLDECGETRSQYHILQVLLKAVQSNSFPLFFLISSRPEHEIRQFFNQKSVNALSRRLVLDERYEPDADIRIFLRARFDDIKKNHPSGSLILNSWPSNSDIERLVEKASGQFIYASTVMKFVESPRHWPSDRLSMVFGLMSPGKHAPFADLDALYSLIFASVDDIERVAGIFTFLLFKGSDVGAQMDTVEEFLFLRPGELQVILNDLHSILYVPPITRGSEQLRIFHASLSDFLLDRTRSGMFFIDPGEAHVRMARYCIKHLSHSFKQGRTSVRHSHTISMARKISYIGLLRHSMMSSLTDELREDLHQLDFEAYLNMPFVTFRGLRDPVEDLPSFFEWALSQSSTDNRHDLKRRYTEHFDQLLKRELSQYPKPAVFHLCSTSTLARFRNHREEVLNILGLPNHISTINILWNETYHRLVVEFLEDANRCGIYHVNEFKYTGLARVLFDDLVRRKTSNNDPIEVRLQGWSLNLLAETLLYVPPDVEFGKYLWDNLVLTGRKGPETQYVLRPYLEKCKLNLEENLLSESRATPIKRLSSVNAKASSVLEDSSQTPLKQSSKGRMRRWFRWRT